MDNFNVADKYLDSKNKSINFVKNKIFDFIAVGIIVAMTALSLGVVELRTMSLKEIADILLECAPFYIAATMLSTNFYMKGSYLAKSNEVFKNAIKYYSDCVNNLSGKQMTMLPQFCIAYNDRILKNMRENMLHSAALTFEQYDEGDDKINIPLKIASCKKLKDVYGKEVANVIRKCKKIKIKGICPNILLSNNINDDSTDLGLDERQLMKRRTISYSSLYLISIFLMSLIAVKDVLKWGWMGAFLTLFKVMYIAINAYMKYFDGYEDINVNVVDHIYRKTDVLKEFEYWYSEVNNEVTK